MPSDHEIDDFIRSVFRSIWSLELLLHLRNNVDRGWSRPDLVDVLRASELIVSQSLDALVAAGLVSIDEDGCARYAPVARDLDEMVDAVGEKYRRAPNAIRRLIVASASGGLTAFADAFKFRKD